MSTFAASLCVGLAPHSTPRRIRHITRSQLKPNAPTEPSSPAPKSIGHLADPAAAPSFSLPWHQLAEGVSTRVTAALLAALVTFGSPLAFPAPTHAVTNEQLLFLEAWRAVDRAYVDKKFNDQNWFKVREDALKKVSMSSRAETYAAIKTLLASLNDPFTRFLDPDQYAALKRTTSGSLTGIGVEVSFSANKGAGSHLVVVVPTPGGPAERAGIKPMDEILTIDGQSTSELSLYAAGGLLQGPEGSEVTVTVKPHTGGAPKELKLKREAITVDPVDSALCSTSGRLAPDAASDKLGYVRIATFSKQTAEKAREAIVQLHNQGATRYVLDVRNNGGGLFPAGVEVGQMWINKGDIVLIADSDGVRDVYDANGTALEPSAPLAVLVNRGTASASEVLAGALKDNGRAIIAGENTFGKGLIQTLVPLSDGSAVAVTVARYQTPAGVDINKIGITPNVVISAEQLLEIPTGGERFCKFAGSDESAPKLF